MVLLLAVAATEAMPIAGVQLDAGRGEFVDGGSWNKWSLR